MVGRTYCWASECCTPFPKLTSQTIQCKTSRKNFFYDLRSYECRTSFRINSFEILFRRQGILTSLPCGTGVSVDSQQCASKSTLMTTRFSDVGEAVCMAWKPHSTSIILPQVFVQLPQFQRHSDLRQCLSGSLSQIQFEVCFRIISNWPYACRTSYETLTKTTVYGPDQCTLKSVYGH